jgi:hypothetical protein
MTLERQAPENTALRARGQSRIGDETVAQGSSADCRLPCYL